MAFQDLGEEASENAQAGQRGPTRKFPSIAFEKALFLPKGILEHSSDSKIDRLTILSRLNISPRSSRTHELIRGCEKYGLTIGKINSPLLEVTDTGHFMVNGNNSHQDFKKKEFQIAVQQFDLFGSFYEKLEGKRLPDEIILGQDMSRSGIPLQQSEAAAKIFIANIRFLKLVEILKGTEYVRSFELAIAQLASADSPSQSANESKREPDPPIVPTEQPNLDVIASKQPSLHIDVQIHIDSTATNEQIDQIFASMAKHFYGDKE